MSASQSCRNSACKTTVSWPVKLPNFAQTVGTANAGDAYDVVSGPSLDHRDDVEQLMGHQAVTYVTKILDTNEAILAESGRRESLKEYFVLREKAVQATSRAGQHRERRPRLPKVNSFSV